MLPTTLPADTGNHGRIAAGVRNRLAPQIDTMSLMASAMKESQKLNRLSCWTPEHQKLKEVSEGIASLFRLMPEQVGPLMTMVTSMLGVM
jgi:hypothetical protein